MRFRIKEISGYGTVEKDFSSLTDAQRWIKAMGWSAYKIEEIDPVTGNIIEMQEKENIHV